MNSDTPSISTSAYGLTGGNAVLTAAAPVMQFAGKPLGWVGDANTNLILDGGTNFGLATPQEQKWMAQQNIMRMVRIYLIDPDERVPLDQRILFSRPEFWTEATDQELHHEIPIRGLLDVHNEARAKIMFKVQGSRDPAEPLEPIRIRDLVIHIVPIAQVNLKKA